MSQNNKFDEEIPQTTVGDWVGAQKKHPGKVSMKNIKNPVEFHIFRASTDHGLFVVTLSGEKANLPECPHNGNWEHFKAVKEIGRPRIGFSEEEAKSDILKQGYHLCRVEVKFEEKIKTGG